MAALRRFACDLFCETRGPGHYMWAHMRQVAGRLQMYSALSIPGRVLSHACRQVVPSCQWAFCRQQLPTLGASMSCTPLTSSATSLLQVAVANPGRPDYAHLALAAGSLVDRMLAWAGDIPVEVRERCTAVAGRGGPAPPPEGGSTSVAAAGA